MYINKVKEKLRNHEMVIGLTMHEADRDIVEMAGIVGFDFVMIDTEHGPLSISEIENLILTAERRGLVPLVRVSEKSQKEILRLLEIGAMGLIFPDCEDADEVRRLISYSKYYPEGNRSLSCMRAADYAINVNRREYRQMANAQLVIIPQLESPEAVSHVEEIAQIDGVDMISFGPNDYSQAIGHIDELTHPEVIEAHKKIRDASIKYGLPIGGAGNSVEALMNAKKMGASMFMVQTTSMIIKLFKEFVEEKNG